MSTYDDVLVVAKTYMGMAAEEYIQRRCKISLTLDNPQNLAEEHLERLAQGIELSAGAYMSEVKAQNFKDDILNLIKGKTKPPAKFK